MTVLSGGGSYRMPFTAVTVENRYRADQAQTFLPSPMVTARRRLQSCARRR